MESFLRTSSPMRVAVLAGPSRSALETIKTLWNHNHSVMSILPSRSRYLTHLLTEGRCGALVTDNTGSEEARSAVSALGLPLIRYAVNESQNSPSINRRVMVEGRVASSTVPLVASISAESFATQVSKNRSIVDAKGTETVLSLSRNWVIDAESFTYCFLGDVACAPTTVCVDTDSLKIVDGLVAGGSLDISRVQRIIYDVLDERIAADSIKEDLKKLNKPVFVRCIVPEVGPVANLVPLESFLGGFGDLKPVAGVEIRIDNGRLLVGSADRTSEYIGRDRTSELSKGEFFETSFLDHSVEVSADSEAEKVTRRKRRIMQPDWRVRQVPIAVYHKRRGFKGQIYYTTKHKGWSFYRSRYYN